MTVCDVVIVVILAAAGALSAARWYLERSNRW